MKVTRSSEVFIEMASVDVDTNCLVPPQLAVMGQGGSYGKVYPIHHRWGHTLFCPLSSGLGGRAIERS